MPIDKSLQENEIVTVLHASDAKAVVFSEALPRHRSSPLAQRGARACKVLHRHGPRQRRDGKVHSMPEMIAAETAAIGSGPVPAGRPGRRRGHRLHLGRHGSGQGRDAVAAQHRREPAWACCR
ncbi:MAG: hypothetical protein MZV64_25180 [Ignavibacteriales bacterium]|nr:hypothetical protein [Ignavibacteriales bacterium]